MPGLVPGIHVFAAVRRVPSLDGHRLWLRFTDGSEGVRDLSLMKR